MPYGATLGPIPYTAIKSLAEDEGLDHDTYLVLQAVIAQLDSAKAARAASEAALARNKPKGPRR